MSYIKVRFRVVFTIFVINLILFSNFAEAYLFEDDSCLRVPLVSAYKLYRKAVLQKAITELSLLPDKMVGYNPKIVGIIIYGSLVKGDFRDTSDPDPSDIDVLVILDTETKIYDLGKNVKKDIESNITSEIMGHKVAISLSRKPLFTTGLLELFGDNFISECLIHTFIVYQDENFDLKAIQSKVNEAWEKGEDLTLRTQCQFEETSKNIERAIEYLEKGDYLLSMRHLHESIGWYSYLFQTLLALEWKINPPFLLEQFPRMLRERYNAGDDYFQLATEITGADLINGNETVLFLEEVKKFCKQVPPFGWPTEGFRQIIIRSAEELINRGLYKEAFYPLLIIPLHFYSAKKEENKELPDEFMSIFGERFESLKYMDPETIKERIGYARELFNFMLSLVSSIEEKGRWGTFRTKINGVIDSIRKECSVRI